MAIAAAQNLTESRFRALAAEIFQRVLAAFEPVDPDVAEAEESLGTVTIRLADGSRWILSVQPPARQIWLAVASLGRAFHYDYDATNGTWRDSKDPDQELFTHLSALLRDVAGAKLDF
jgi:CyaY protein